MNRSGWLCLLIFVCILHQVDSTEEFRSYHPHYLHSYSYAQPSTLHLYYGRVVNNRPLFLIKDAEEQEAESIYLVNTPNPPKAQPKLLNLKRQVDLHTRSRTMLVFSLQDSFDAPRVEPGKLHTVRTHWGYLVALANGTHSQLYEIHVTKDGKLVVPSRYIDNHLQLSLRNISGNPKENWRISRNLQWNDNANDDLDSFPQPITRTVHGNIQTAPLESVSAEAALDSQPKPVLPALKSFTAVTFQVSIPLDELSQFNVHINRVTRFKKEPTVDSLYELVNPIEQDIVSSLQQKHQQLLEPPTCESRAVQLLFRGLSFEYGRIKVVHDATVIPNEPRELLSFSPSRKRFPWGFLWDDGFHNEIAARVEPDTALKIIKSWLDTMIDGWIPREQDRGTQRVELCNCERFLAKDDRDGNPPSLVLPLNYLLRTGYLTIDRLEEKYWLKLKQWHNWFMRTQMVGAGSYLFKWFDHIQSGGSFNSGMDDFPRPPNTQYHVDAQAWMYELTKFMALASQTFEKDAAPFYQEQMNKIKDNLQLFLEPTKGIYLDVLMGNDGSRAWSPYIGYGSVLPLSFGMVDSGSPQFKTTLNLLTSQEMLNTRHGLSSIARNSPEYMRSADAYWRGPIWINMNYAALRGLKLFYPIEGDLVYQQLRSQLMGTVCGEWERAGYFFENYKEGVGSFSYPFNGWTSLIALVINEEY